MFSLSLLLFLLFVLLHVHIIPFILQTLSLLHSPFLPPHLLLTSPSISSFLYPPLSVFFSLKSVDPAWTTPPSSLPGPPWFLVAAKVREAVAASSEAAWDTTAATRLSRTPSTTWPSCHRPTTRPWNLRSTATARWRGWVSRWREMKGWKSRKKGNRSKGWSGTERSGPLGAFKWNNAHKASAVSDWFLSVDGWLHYQFSKKSLFLLWKKAKLVIKRWIKSLYFETL